MYGPPFYPDRPRTESTGGHARRALQDMMIHDKKVKGGLPARSKLEDDMHRLRNKWPRQVLARQRRDSIQQSVTLRSQRDVLLSQLSQVRAQMPAWGGPALHVTHREYILEALRKIGAPQAVATPQPTYTTMETQTETTGPRAQETAARE